MCLPIPHLVGKVDVEERRPRYWNEPRRKRLNFVNDHHDRRSDEWALTPKSQPNQHPRNEQERWDLRQFEAQNRFQQRQLGFDNHRRMQQIQQAQQMQQIYGPRPPMHPQQGHPMQGHPRQQQVGQHPHHEHDDDIIDIITESSSDSDSDHPGPRTIQMIERKPKKKYAPMPKQIKMAKKPKRHWADESDSDDSHEAALGRLSRSRSRARSRRRSGSRHKITIVDSDSDDSSSVMYVKNLPAKHTSRGRR